MRQIFISHSAQDFDAVERIANALTQAGMTVWLDREDVRTGEAWQVQIVEAIDHSHVFVLALSPNSAALEDVRVEVDLAQDTGLTTIPFMLEPVKIPATIRYQLAGLPIIDAPSLGFEKALGRLVESVRAVVEGKGDRKD